MDLSLPAGTAVVRDREGLAREVPLWSPEQQAASVHRAARRLAAAELAERPVGPRVGRRKAQSDRVRLAGCTKTRPCGEPACRCEDRHEWRPEFAALAERALLHPWCVRDDPASAPKEALLRMRHDTCASEFVGLKSCDLRLCAGCNSRRFAEELGKVDAWLAKAQVPKWSVRMVTLTMRNVDVLADGVRRLLAGVAALRRRNCFKRYVRGGVVAIQWTKYGATWHVHAHVVCVGVYLPRDELAEAWRDIMGDDALGEYHGTWVNLWGARDGQPWDPSKAVKEALGYVYPTKERRYARIEDYAEVEIALRGRRLMTTFGELHGIETPRRERACAACAESDAAWTVLGPPPPVEHAAFLHALKAATLGDMKGLVCISKGRKAQERDRRELEIITRRETNEHVHEVAAELDAALRAHGFDA